MTLRATMSTQHSILSKLATDLRYHDTRLDQACRASLGISVKVFKVIRAITQLLGVFAALYAMHMGVDLELALVVALTFYVGPEGVEKVLMARQSDA